MHAPQRSGARGALLRATLAIALALAACGDGQTDRARNVLLISIDTCRADHLGCYGEPRDTTPNLDALAADGTLFLQASSTNAVTLPAHSSLLTGTLPPVHGVLDNKFHLDPSNRTLAEVLVERGLATAAFVSSFMLDSRFGIAQGFEHYDDEFPSAEPAGGGETREINERVAADTVDAAEAWLRQHGAQPFFAFVHFFDPHAVHQPPEPFATRFADDLYAGEIAYVDAQIGRLLGTLERLDLADDTLVIVTADHGESLGDHGEDTHSWFVYQSTIHVPLIVRAPGGAVGGVVRDPVSLVDLAPTVLAQLGLPREDAMQGRDLTPFIEGRDAPAAALPVYAESLAPTLLRAAPLRAVRRGRWKFVETVEPELYDLDTDAGELSNRYAEEPEVVAGLRGELGDLLELRRTDGATPTLDRDSLERIRSLGYSEGSVRVSYEVDPDAGDAKQLLAVYRRLREARMLIARDDLEAAYALCRELTAERPWLLEAHGVLGGIRFEQGRHAEAAGHFEDYVAAVDAQQAEQGGGGLLEAGLGSQLVYLGNARLALGQIEAARAAYGRAVAVAPGDVEAQLALANLLAQHERRYAEAIAVFERALELEPRSVETLCALGNCHFALGQLERAVPHYRAALELQPDAPDVQYNLGSLLFQLGRFDEAQVPLRAALRLAPENPDARRTLGLALACAGSCEEARTELLGLVRTQPAALARLYTETLSLAAHAEDARRNPAAALCIASALNAAALEREARLLELLAVAQAASGDYPAAIASSERALVLAADEDAALRARIEQRRELYRAGRPFRLEPRPAQER